MIRQYEPKRETLQISLPKYAADRFRKWCDRYGHKPNAVIKEWILFITSQATEMP